MNTATASFKALSIEGLFQALNSFSIEAKLIDLRASGIIKPASKLTLNQRAMLVVSMILKEKSPEKSGGIPRTDSCT